MSAGSALSAAKALVGQSGRLIGEQAVQLHGGMGMTDELAVGHYFKRLLGIDLSFGDSEHHLERLWRVPMSEAADEVLQVRREGSIAVMTMNYPLRRNAFNMAMRTAMYARLLEIEAERGLPGTWCSRARAGTSAPAATSRK